MLARVSKIPLSMSRSVPEAMVISILFPEPLSSICHRPKVASMRKGLESSWWQTACGNWNGVPLKAAFNARPRPSNESAFAVPQSVPIVLAARGLSVRGPNEAAKRRNVFSGGCRAIDGSCRLLPRHLLAISSSAGLLQA